MRTQHCWCESAVEGARCAEVLRPAGRTGIKLRPFSYLITPVVFQPGMQSSRVVWYSKGEARVGEEGWSLMEASAAAAHLTQLLVMDICRMRAHAAGPAQPLTGQLGTRRHSRQEGSKDTGSTRLARAAAAHERRERARLRRKVNAPRGWPSGAAGGVSIARPWDDSCTAARCLTPTTHTTTAA